MKKLPIYIVALLMFCITHSALAVSLTDSQMYLDPDDVPYDFYDRISLDDLDVDNDYVWVSGGDDIIDADILPVLKEGPGAEGEYPLGYVYSQSDYYQTPNVDYFAEITAGDLTVTILVSGQYNVRVNRNSGESKIWTVFAETGMLEESATCELGNNTNKTGASRKISGPSGDLIIVSKGDSTLDQAAKNIQNEDDGSGTGTKKKVSRAKGVDDVISKIKAASRAAGKKIHVEIVGHGAPGMISTNNCSTADGDLIGPDDADIAEFQEAIDDYVEGLSLFSCNSAKGTDGDKLLALLASSLGWASGYTVPITVEKGYFNIKNTATKTLTLCPDTLVPISDYIMGMKFSDFSMSAESIPIEIEGTVYDTGELLITRDLESASDSDGIFIDFGDGSIVESMHAILDCPLFTTMDIPSQKLHIMQIGGPGTITVVPDSALINPTLPTAIGLYYNNPLANESYFEPNQLMDTWEFDYEQREFSGGYYHEVEVVATFVHSIGDEILQPAAPLIRFGLPYGTAGCGVSTIELEWDGTTFSPIPLHSFMQMEQMEDDELEPQEYGNDADLNEDGCVNLLDFVTLAEAWLDCVPDE